jgi:hypothetical protein
MEKINLIKTILIVCFLIYTINGHPGRKTKKPFVTTTEAFTNRTNTNAFAQCTENYNVVFSGKSFIYTVII